MKVTLHVSGAALLLQSNLKLNYISIGGFSLLGDLSGVRMGCIYATTLVKTIFPLAHGSAKNVPLVLSHLAIYLSLRV